MFYRTLTDRIVPASSVPISKCILKSNVLLLTASYLTLGEILDLHVSLDNSFATISCRDQEVGGRQDRHCTL